jgi:hypothetical protein
MPGSIADQLLQLEERFWKSDAEFYRERLTADALMVFADPIGVMTKQAIVESISAGPRWHRIEFDDVNHMSLKPDVVLLTYRATAEREGAAEGEYSARVSSVYVECDGSWQLAFHQQTPAP